MNLIDIGANLTHESFDGDATRSLHARRPGVSQMVVTGASRADSRSAALAQQRPGVLYSTAGVHPHHALEFTAEGESDLRLLHANRRWSPWARRAWTISVTWAPRPRRNARSAPAADRGGPGKPVFLHQRDDHDDFVAVMQRVRGAAGPGGGALLHRHRRELFDAATATARRHHGGCATNPRPALRELVRRSRRTG